LPADERESTRLLHTWTGELTVLGVRALAQACLYSADTVLIPASVTVQAGVTEDERAFIHAQVGRLMDLGAIVTWGVDGVDRGPITARAPAQIISRERYQDIYRRAIDLLMDRRTMFLGGHRSTRFDGVTEVVVGKHAVIHSLLAEELSASAILHDKDSADGYARFLTDLLNPAGLVAQIASSVAIELDLPEASALPDSLYDDARQKLRHFRAYIMERLRASGPILHGDAALEDLREAIVRDVVQAYLEHVAAQRGRKATPLPWLRDLWRLRRMDRLSNQDTGSEPLQVLYELNAAGRNR
jgi:hypothetical protein